MSKVFNSTNTAKTINDAISNIMGTTTTSQGATADGLIVKEDLQPVVECVNGFDYAVHIKTITGIPPLTFHSMGQTLTWSLDGNTDSGESVGNSSRNIFNGHERITGSYLNDTGVIGQQANYSISDYIDVTGAENVTLSSTAILGGGASICQYNENYTYITGTKYNNENVVTISIESGCKYIAMSFKPSEVGNIMVNVGDTPLSYEPYGVYGIPIIVNTTDTYHCYITDVLRKSSGETPVYDTMNSDGTITRRVDTDGTPLEEPITETYTAPSVNVSWGNNTVDVDTTVAPTSMTITYKDN